MFKPTTDRIEKLSKLFPRRIEELENIFYNKVNIYIDWSNVFRWQNKLKWRIDVKRLKQLLDSFTNINEIKFYDGTLTGDRISEEWITHIKELGYASRTKPVKIRKISIDVSSIPLNSPFLLENFIRKSLLKKADLETIEFLNRKLLDLNKQGIYFLEDPKCNFDVEIGRDMLLDYERNHVDTFILWSGDSDFVDPIEQLIKDKKKVFIFSTARRVSAEFEEINVPIFEIKKIKEFICWPKDLTLKVKSQINNT